MKKIGVIGFSDGNGHPLSFSAIVNGYDRQKFSNLGWDVISKYLSKREPQEFGVADLLITDIWMPDRQQANAVAEACYIERVHKDYWEMVSNIDGVMILRDDWKSHKPIAEPFLSAKIPTYIDKPLTLSRTELEWFLPFIEKGELFSCAPFKLSREVEQAKAKRNEYGKLLSVNATVSGTWEKYGIHIIDSVFRIISEKPCHIIKQRIGNNVLRQIQIDNGASFLIQNHEELKPTFNINFFFQSGHLQVKIEDNFTAFKNVIHSFERMIETGLPPFAPCETAQAINLLIDGA